LTPQGWRDSLPVPSRRGIAVAHFFREPDRRQRFLLPVDMMDWFCQLSGQVAQRTGV
jgi:hypothetical protein